MPTLCYATELAEPQNVKNYIHFPLMDHSFINLFPE